MSSCSRPLCGAVHGAARDDPDVQTVLDPATLIDRGPPDLGVVADVDDGPIIQGSCPTRRSPTRTWSTKD